MSDDALELLVRAQVALGLTNKQLAEAVGTSLRTVERWSSRHSHPHASELRKLAVLVHSQSADLGAKLAALTGDTLESLGLVVPAPPPVVEPSGPTPQILPHALPRNVIAALVESVVAAAAETMDVSPRVVRPVLLAAVEHAKSIGLDIDDLLSVLRPAPPPVKRLRKR